MTGGPLLQMRFHFGERDRAGDGPLERAVMDACARDGVRAAALLRAVEGFGAKHAMRTDRLLTLSEDPPLVTVAVGEPKAIEGLAADVREIAASGLIALEPVVEAADAGELEQVRATIWGPRSGPRSPHLGAVDALHRHGAEAAMVLLGVDGVIDGRRHRARFVGANHDVPALTVAVGAREEIEAALADLDGAAHLVTVEAVESFRRIGTVSLHSDALDGAATRVALATREDATCGAHHPRYVEFVHRLRTEGAAGATALRGAYGFRGGVAPHGDRVLGLRRDVPMLVEVVDEPGRAERWREIALELADGDDVVTSRPVGRTFTLE